MRLVKSGLAVSISSFKELTMSPLCRDKHIKFLLLGEGASAVESLPCVDPSAGTEDAPEE
jgi:hypothetical protein